jgi:hypothetical protein
VKRELLALYLAIIAFKNLLLDHPMGVEERAIESDAMAHYFKISVSFFIKCWDDYSFELVIERLACSARSKARPVGDPTCYAIFRG